MSPKRIFFSFVSCILTSKAQIRCPFSSAVSRKNKHLIWILQVKNARTSISSIRKILSIPKIQVDNSKCPAITVTKKRLKYFFFIQDSVFWPEKSKSDVHFRRPRPDNIDNRGKRLVKIRLLRVYNFFFFFFNRHIFRCRFQMYNLFSAVTRSFPVVRG